MEDSIKPEFRYDERGHGTAKPSWFPTDEYRRALMLDFAKRFGLVTFVETGTCDGNTTKFASEHFKQVFTIELSDFYYYKALETFRDYKNVIVIHGDSGVELRKLLAGIPKTPTLFYLDAHCSGGFTAQARYSGPWAAPLREEITAILDSNPQGVIVIDDMQDFWNIDLPEQMTETVAKYPDWSCEIKAGLGRIWRKDAAD